jgi:hypothetical protein
MANEEQLAILKSGVEIWNRWRFEHRTQEIDLRRAGLSGTDLHGAKLNEADRGSVAQMPPHLPAPDRVEVGRDVV